MKSNVILEDLRPILSTKTLDLRVKIRSDLKVGNRHLRRKSRENTEEFLTSDGRQKFPGVGRAVYFCLDEAKNKSQKVLNSVRDYPLTMLA